VQGHENTIAVAVLREIAAVVLSGDGEPSKEAREKASQEGIPILRHPGSTYDLAGRFHASGLRNPGC